MKKTHIRLSPREFASDGIVRRLVSIRFIVEEDTGDIVDSAVYNRNAYISEYLNTNIEIIGNTSTSKLFAEVEKSVMAGAADFDVIGGYQAYSISMSATGMLGRHKCDVRKLAHLKGHLQGRGHL